MLRQNAVFGLVAMGFVPLVCIVLMAGCPFIPTPECASDADCADGQVCEDGVCVEAPDEPLHKTLFTDNLGDPNYQGTETCLTCHSDHAADIMETGHWNWGGAVDNIAGLEGQTHGKVDLINDY